jgi:RimJ/RimL family protein N-acetyltransferase
VLYGNDFRAEHTLRDGTRVTLRAIQPSDRDELRRQFSRLSPESRYRRFFHPISELTEEMLDYLTQVDGLDHLAIVAWVDSLDLKNEEGVGVGRFVRLPGEPEVAEAAVTVVDDFQRRGVGTILLRALGEAAKERGIRRFRGEVLTSNEPMRRLCEEAGAKEGSSKDGTTSFDVPLDAVPEVPSKETVLQKMLRVAASSMVIWLSHLIPRSPSSIEPDGDPPS